ncbi:hypothetical protein H0G86_000289 [Trichoderma simmonsii]|uniref:Uncharacterized protein n=1 Tax=Trichoderma simmonsii TaxID=1491479 RepID=A0A8G0PDT4_9HYPO|nr:hypothetical protein H0G86_000289 [Trichoderma simmonsii]
MSEIDSEKFDEFDEGDRLSSLLSLCPRYVIVPANPPDGIAFALTGHCQEWEHLTYQHEGISNCKPGIWKAEVRKVPGMKLGDADLEACLRWVADLDENTELDFAISLDAWQAWEQMFKDQFDDFVQWGEGVTWKHGGTYYDDGGLFNVISTAYLTADAAATITGGKYTDWGYDGYLEIITLNDNEGNDIRNYGFNWGGLHFVQDSIGAPPAIALAEKDGQVVGIKLWCNNHEIEEGTPFDEQPGKLVF